MEPASLHPFRDQEELLAALADFGTSERLAALDVLRTMVGRADRDSQLLDGREYDPVKFDEAYRLLALLRVKEERR